MDKLKMESVDLTAQNIEKIGALFPNCITETADENGKLKKAINFDMLKQMLSDEVAEGDEAYEFTWVGKKEAIVEANKPIRKTLRPCKEESVNWDSTENLYIEGDNLEVLKLLQESYLGKVKMIYIDPPYNTGNDFIYNDDFKMTGEEYADVAGEIDEDGNRMVKNADTNGRFHSDWCSMIYSRLMLARNLLSDDGVIFISIDDNELENLKKICEEVFSEVNFIANIIWKHTQQSKNDERHFSRQYNHTLVYAKNKRCVDNFYFERTPEDNKNDRLSSQVQHKKRMTHKATRVIIWESPHNHKTGGSNMCHYTHFTTEEREKSRVLKAQGLSIRAIARELGRAPSSVSREFRRNCYANGDYAAYHADRLYRKRRKNCGRKAKLLDDEIRNYVMEKMNLCWSPEQIAGRAKRDKEPFCISFPTIYRAIDSGILPPQLKKIMRFKWKHKKCKGTDNRGKIPDTTPISERPAGAENRSRYGHWESDTVLGMRKTGCFGTHVERKSGYLVAFRIAEKRIR